MAEQQIWILIGGISGAAIATVLLAGIRRWLHPGRAESDEIRNLRILAALGNDWFWATDAEHRYENVFGALDAVERSPLADIHGLHRWDLSCPEDFANNPDKWRQHRDDLNKHRPFDDFHLNVSKPDGNIAVMSVSGRPVYAADGSFRGYRGISREITEEIDHQQRLAAERRRLADALEALDTAIALFDTDGRLILHNQRMAELVPAGGQALVRGMRHDEICRDLFGCDDAAIIGNGHRDIDLPDGRCLQVSERRTADGQTIIAATDISVIKRQASEAPSATHKLAMTLRSIDQGLIVLDAEGRLITWNPQVFRLMGAPNDIGRTGMHMRELIRTFAEHGGYGRPLSDDDIEERFRVIMSCQPPVLELRMPDGHMLDSRRTRMPDGGVAITTTDITVLKQREDELARTSRALEVVFDTISEGIALVNRDDALVSVNDRMLELIGLNRDGLGRDDPILRYCRAVAAADPSEADAAEHKIRECHEHYEANQAFVLERIENTGRAIEFEVNPTADGGRVVTCRDITERRRHVQELRAAKELAELANRAKTEFLANTSHELRTPLNAIIGFAEMIQTQTFGPIGSHKYLEYARDIRDSGSHLLSLINDLLDLAKIEAGRHELYEAPLSLPDMLTNCIRLVRERADAGKVKLEAALAPEVSTIFADERAMKQILINLLSNAVKFTSPGGRVTVTNRRLDDGAIEIAVADNGIGMAPADIPKALAPFGQVDGHLARRFEGTDLGLPLAQRLIQRHGGTLTIESQKDVGTTVYLRLPPDRHIAHLGGKLTDRQLQAG